VLTWVPDNNPEVCYDCLDDHSREEPIWTTQQN